MLELKQFVPSSVCLSCEGCCRFKEEKSEWLPKLTSSERLRLQVALKEDHAIPTVAHCGQYHCTFLNHKNNTCRIYSLRPFECQLYPFVLMRKDGKIAFCVHLACPYIQQYNHTKEFLEHVQYLKGIFCDLSWGKFLKENPMLIGSYADAQNELEPLFFLELP